LAFTSRDTVDGARPNRPAITRNDSSASKPPRIASRSAADNRAGDGSHTTRRVIPPASRITVRTMLAERATSRATSTVAIPPATKAMIRFRSDGINFGYRPLFAFPTATSQIESKPLNPTNRCDDR
jgi:hypothetical protein